MSTKTNTEETTTGVVAEKKIPWASEAVHKAIAKVCFNADIAVEDYLEALRIDSNYIENGRRIHGAKVASEYYLIKAEKATKERIAKIKAKNAEEAKASAEENSANEGAN